MNLFNIFLVLELVVLRLTQIYTYAIIIYCLLSMCLGFGILRQHFAFKSYDFLSRIIEPALRPIRSLLPDLGSFDYAPLVLILILNYAVPYCLKKLLLLIWVAQGQF